mgnify:FL=1
MEVKAFGNLPEVFRPRDAAEACGMKKTFGADGAYVAGSTLLRVHWESGAAPMPGKIIDLTSIPGLSGIRTEDGRLVIGSLVKLTELTRAEAVLTGFPLLAEAAGRIGAPSIRNLATIGGNVACRIGDALTALLVYDADLIWHTGERTEAARLADWLADPGPQPDDRLLVGIRLAPADEAEPGRIVGAFRKLGRREAFTASLVTIAVLGQLAEDGTLAGVRIAAGGGSAVPARLRAAEAVLEGGRATPDALIRLAEAVMNEYKPASDVFAGADYRRLAAANLIAAEVMRLAGAGRGDAS